MLRLLPIRRLTPFLPRHLRYRCIAFVHADDGSVAPHDDILSSLYRAVRPIEGGAGPLPGMLTCLPSGERRVLVDVGAVDEGWPGWTARPDGHVLAALDIVRRGDGHDVATEVCVEGLVPYLDRRREDGHGLSPGEAVTVGVSVLRGCAELKDRPHVTGEWWISETGRPLFAAGAGQRPLAESSAAILRELASPDGSSAVWESAATVVERVRASDEDHDRAEAAVFDLAPPGALRAVGARDAWAGSRPEWGPPRSAGETPETHADRQPMWHSLTRHVDADLADFASRMSTAIWRRLGSLRGRRTKPLLIAAVAALAVLGVGLSLPGDDAGRQQPATDPTPSASETGGADRTDAPEPSRADADASGSAASAAADPAVAGADLLDRLRGCDDDRACRTALVMADAEGWDAGAVSLPPDERAVTLLDDFGGVAVLRVDAIDGGVASQVVVLGLRQDEWLLRDVHDIAQQP